ncbi:MAG: hypothetical protein AAFN79_10530 [Pseudomonadota bacterium]
MTAPWFKAHPPERMFLAAACIAFPAFVYAVAFWQIAGRRLVPGELTTADLGIAFVERSPASLAADLAARETYLIASVAMLLIAVISFGYALGAIRRSRGTTVMAVAGLFAVIVGGVALAYQGNPLRDLVVEAPLDAASPWGAEAMREGMRLFVSINTFLGLAAVGAMMIRFADLALGSPNGADDPAEGADRGGELREALVVGSAILTSATVATYFYYHYPLALMTEASAKAFAPLSALGSLRWGAAYAAILAAAAAPAVAALVAERKASPQRQAGDRADTGWMNAEAWSARIKAFGALLAIIAPAVATPILEVLAPLLK